ncbi:MAG: YggS family pyridoxal phosphate-dependent enzyme [Calditrichales bacterium]|nr:MAG: YggS family pyridoxal phosphate-dependent enzyme [Calditrichales bacterium]
MKDTIKNNVENVREKIANAAESVGRNADEITLVAVSKKQPIEKIIEAQAAGITAFGENQVQELLQKQAVIDLDVHWHLVGHLQSNKVNKVYNRVALIQSADSLSLIRKLDSAGQSGKCVIDLLLQVNTSGETSKFGFMPEAVDDICAAVESMTAVRVKGLMTIGPLTDDIKSVTRAFADLRKIFDRLSSTASGSIRMTHISMGMSGDFDIAIKEGSNLVRVGTSIFGQRTY